MVVGKTTTVAGGFLLPEGPRWHDGSLWFVDMLRGNVNRLTGSTVQRVVSFDHPNSVGFRPNGDLLVTDSMKRLLHTLRDDEVVGSLDLGWLANGHINDMTVDRYGRAYIDDTGGGDPFKDGWQSHGRILLVLPDGSGRVVAEGLLSPNGIAISPDGRTLVVGESMGPGGAPNGARSWIRRRGGRLVIERAPGGDGRSGERRRIVLRCRRCSVGRHLVRARGATVHRRRGGRSFRGRGTSMGVGVCVGWTRVEDHVRLYDSPSSWRRPGQVHGRVDRDDRGRRPRVSVMRTSGLDRWPHVAGSIRR